MQNPEQRPRLPSSLNGVERQVRQVDMETGEILDGVPMLVPQKRHYVFEGYSIVFDRALDAITEDPDIKFQDLRVALKIVRKVGYRNEWQIVNLTDLGKELNMKQPNVSAAIKRLILKGIVIRGARIGRGHAIRLNPKFAWKGPKTELQAAQKSAPPLRFVKGGKIEEEEPIAKILSDLGEPTLFSEDTWVTADSAIEANIKRAGMKETVLK